MQATLRCVTGAAMFSSVIGGLAYGTAKRQCDEQRIEFEQIAQDECLANDPNRIINEEPTTVQGWVERQRRLQSLHKICTFGLGGDRHV
jgi:hypothetical protein